jgi:protein-tyrosine phosphatase
VRELHWDGCWNVRDLGGLATYDGGVTRFGQIVRADALDRLSASGWDAVLRHGVRTIIDLRNEEERRGDVAPRPPEVTTVHFPLDGSADREFWQLWESGPQFGTPLYYRPHLERMPQRSVAVLRAIARASAGGVAFHCQGGRDRSGQISMLVLALVGVRHEEIAADYALSEASLGIRAAALGEADQQSAISASLAARRTTTEEILLNTLADFDISSHLRSAGLREDDVAALRARLL